MSTDYEKKISQLKESLDKAKNLKIRAEARLEELGRQRTEMLSKLELLGVSPNDLDQEIVKLRGNIDALIKEAENIATGF